MGTTAVAAYTPSLLQRLVSARARTDELFAIVRPEALYDRPIAERHRIIFYVGHLEAFDWNLLGTQHFGMTAFHPEFDQLFAFGIDPVGGGLPTDVPADWPSRDKVEAYCLRIRNLVDGRLADTFDPFTEQPAETAQLLNVAIEHRLMHAETLAYMLHQLPIDRKCPRQDARAPEVPPVTPHMVRIPAGTATLGMPRQAASGETPRQAAAGKTPQQAAAGKTPRQAANAENPLVTVGPFGWDNEFGETKVAVPEFSIDAYKVTNGEFVRFVAEGGYQNQSLWEPEAWAWVTSSGTVRPGFWNVRDNKIFLRTMFGEIPLPLDWPVYVSQAEAAAYARWAGKTLPTEAQWHRAAYGTPEGTERAFPWGDELPNPSHGNFDFLRWDPSPVGAFPAGNSAFGVSGLMGNGWEWTRTQFAPLPGFESFSFYPGYSANFFDGKHYVMKGASSRTAACMLRRTFRNWFQPHYPFVYSGFRCVQEQS